MKNLRQEKSLHDHGGTGGVIYMLNPEISLFDTPGLPGAGSRHGMTGGYQVAGVTDVIYGAWRPGA
jgi:hypothetical protein